MRRIRFLGHPIHPPLVHFPMAFLLLPFPLEAASAVLGMPDLLRYATYAGGLGLLAAIPALITGFLDFAALGSDEKAMDKAIWHMLLMLAGVACLAGDFAAGFARGTDAPLLLRLALSGVGLTVIAMGGFVGADLIWRHGVGREEEGRHGG
jgi:uncharacterized membrane protein